MATRTTIPAGRPASSGTPGAPPRQTPSLLLCRYSWCVVAYNVLVILWGAVVRSTGSGNGCGDHWPLCNGTVVQHWRTLASVIEFAHRASVGVGVLLLILLVGWTWKSTPKRHLARVFAGASALLTFNEALLGALLVLLHHTGADQSPMRAFWLSLHLTNTLVLLAALALTAHFLGRETGRMRGGIALHHIAFGSVALTATLAVGVTGSLAALGDTLYPARSLAQAFAQDLSSHANWLLRVRWIHPALSFVAAAWILFLIGQLWQSESRPLAATVGGLVLLQIALGVADVLLLAPTWLQVTHLLGADLLWIALVVLSASLCIRPLGCPGHACAFGKRRSPQPAAAEV